MRGAFCSETGCLSGSLPSRYLLPSYRVYSAASRNRTTYHSRMLRVPVYAASCVVRGACCLILFGSRGGRSRLSLNMADRNDRASAARRAVSSFYLSRRGRAVPPSGVEDAGVGVDRLVQVGGGDGQGDVQLGQVAPVRGEPGAGGLGLGLPTSVYPPLLPCRRVS